MGQTKDGSTSSPQERRRVWDKERLKTEAKEWGQSLVIALILTLVIRTYVIQAFKIPSGSMRPTLMEGDKLFVNKFIYRFQPPKRGDIIVFKYPVDRKKDFIKRLTAFEGETVEIRDGKIYVDGSVLDDPETFGRFYYYNHEPYGGPDEKIAVPKGSYYVLGDNSANSTDSRFWGFIPKKYLLGKAIFRWWPPRRMGKL
ncbi:MAG: signal peptidase I [Candidatus Omnitrophica bacterium]|nr:signal peptidase I [Candidatus Omnitrophota bacterium]